MYLENDKYECDFCHTVEDEENDIDSQIWECEECGKHFCRRCFIKRHGVTAYLNMIINDDKIKCIDCYSIGG